MLLVSLWILVKNMQVNVPLSNPIKKVDVNFSCLMKIERNMSVASLNWLSWMVYRSIDKNETWFTTYRMEPNFVVLDCWNLTVDQWNLIYTRWRQIQYEWIGWQGLIPSSPWNLGLNCSFFRAATTDLIQWMSRKQVYCMGDNKFAYVYVWTIDSI